MNNTTRNLSIIIPAYIKLAQPKPSPNRKNNLKNGNQVTQL